MKNSMKVSKSLLWPCAILLFIVLPARAQEIEQPAPKYRMELAYIFDTDTPEYVFVIGGVVGCKSVASLKKYLSLLPPGSILEWAPGCKQRGNEPLLSSEQEMENFKAFLRREEYQLYLDTVWLKKLRLNRTTRHWDIDLTTGQKFDNPPP